MNRYTALLKVIQLGSFSKAAAELGFTQSAVSQMVASVEEELSFKILNRYRGGAALTPEGERILPYIEKAVYRHRSIREKAREITGLDSGVVRMGTLASISVRWLPRLLKSFKNTYPNVEFVIHQGDYNSIDRRIRIGRIDFGFVSPAVSGDMDIIELKDGDMLAVLPKDNPLAGGKAVPLRELAKLPYILLEEGRFSEPLAAFAKIGLYPDIKYTIHDDYTIMSMVEQNMGVSVLSRLILQRNSFDIAALPTIPPIKRRLCIGCKDYKSLPIASKKFIEHVKSMAAQMP